MTTRSVPHARAQHHQLVQEEQRRHRRLQLLRRAAVLVAVVAALAMAVFALVTSAPTASTSSAAAPSFTLPSTAGGSVSLTDYRGKPVILYFNEGAGCGTCFVQMAEIEKDPGFAAAGITVLPIVMNTAAELGPDLSRYQVRSPYLLDDGSVSTAYDVLGKGMHEGLPGHSFVLIDKNGIKRWSGNYPSMWLAPTDLLREVITRL